MKTMKKLSALIIALALVMGMAVNSFAFSDVPSTYTHNDAIELLTALNIIGGYEDGTFRPDNNISREEFLKMVYALLNGTYEAAIYSGTTMFNDVNYDRWSTGYINWAVSHGIVGGYPDGGFHPADNVTIAEASKMLVTALGFEAKNYTFPYGFIAQASLLRLYNNVSGLGPDIKATRGVIAEMTYNALFASSPEFAGTISKEVFKFSEVDAQLVGTSGAVADSGISAKDKIALSVNGETKIFSFDGSADDKLMQNVRVMFIDSNANNLPDAGEAIIGLRVVDSEKITFSTNAVYTKNGIYYVKDSGGKEVRLGDGTLPSVKVVNGARNDEFSFALASKSDMIVTFVDNLRDGSWDAMLAEDPAVDRITSINTVLNKIVTTTTGFANLKDSQGNPLVKLDEGVKAGDDVIIKTSNTYRGTIYEISKAAKVGGVVFTRLSGNVYTLGGKDYLMAADAATSAPTSFGGRYDLILDAMGNIYSAVTTGTVETEQYFFIKAIDVIGSINKTYTAIVLMPDGTEKSIVMDKAFTDGNYFDGARGWLDEDGKAYGEEGFDVNSIAAIGHAFRYTLNGDGAVRTIKDMNNAGGTLLTGSKVEYSKATGALKVDGVISAFMDADTIVYVRDGNSYSVYSGKDVPSFGATSYEALMVRSSNYVKLLVLSEKPAELETVSTDKLGIILSRSLNAGSQSGKIYYEFVALVDGQTVTVRSEEKNSVDELAGYGIADNTLVLMSFKPDGEIEAMAEQTPGTTAGINQAIIKSRIGSYYNFASFAYDASQPIGSRLSAGSDNYLLLSSELTVYMINGSPISGGEIVKTITGKVTAGSVDELIPSDGMASYVVNYHVAAAGADAGKVDVIFIYALPIDN